MSNIQPELGISRDYLATLIVNRLSSEAERMHAEFITPGRISSTCIDNLLPPDVAKHIFDKFPTTDRMTHLHSIKERKHTTEQMNELDPLLEEAFYAFQDSRVVELLHRITGLKELEPDSGRFAGGISLMTKGGYLRPHLDNSHDTGQARYRVLNALYYVSPEWREEYGGSLQLWDDGPQTTPRTFPSLFNRLVLMATNRTSWHSVNEIIHDGQRCCVSSYYFSAISPDDQPYFHATTFRGEKAGVEDLIMRADNALRTTILKTVPGAYKSPHKHKPGRI